MNSVGIGIPELLIMVIPVMFTVVLFGAAVWAAVTLHRIRLSQESIAATLKAMEGELRRRNGRPD
jgi:hypothetical protein